MGRSARPAIRIVRCLVASRSLNTLLDSSSEEVEEPPSPGPYRLGRLGSASLVSVPELMVLLRLRSDGIFIWDYELLRL